MAWRGAVAATLLILAGASPARGWGARGHRIATRVAMARLTPEAKAAVEAILNPGDSLVDLANWADHEGFDAVPGSGPWHYVNVPIAEDRYQRTFCSDRGCVVSKVEHYRAVLSDPKTPRKDRQRALLFLVHFVEDMHQPLHVGDNRDRGGNQTQVQFFGQGSNLHRVWDSSIIDRLRETDKEWADDLLRSATPERVREWSGKSAEDWATESLIAAKAAYHPGGARAALAPGARLGQEYVDLAAPIIRDRLARAGVRLADELNAAFATAPEARRPSSAPRRAAQAAGRP